MTNSLQAMFAERWLALSRRFTVHMLGSRLCDRAQTRAYEPKPNSLLYVAASTLPYHTSGYTTRTHEVIRALKATGANVEALTRPGYPWDRKDRRADTDRGETAVDDVRYQHVNRPHNNRPVLLYALQAAPVIAELASQKRVGTIHAASNHTNALPALLAARRLGIPFQYEMRGLWELTRISRMPEFEGSQAFHQGLELEALVARHADRLFVISDALGNYVCEHWGVAPERMALLPNCVDPSRFTTANPQSIDPNSIGYAGSLIVYEGLDTLIDAVAIRARAGDPVGLTIVGDGEARPQLESQVQRLGLSDRVRFLGRMSPQAARETLGRCAVVCIPRRPFKVCEIVPPIKLVEALAMGKPVIVSDLPVLRDEMGPSPAGWFFKAGDAVDLARVIAEALADRETLATLGARARKYAVTQRCWSDFVIDVPPGIRGEGLYGRPGDQKTRFCGLQLPEGTGG
jgi:glycosyltransferase involved in cell wall biosynthesis